MRTVLLFLFLGLIISGYGQDGADMIVETKIPSEFNGCESGSWPHSYTLNDIAHHVYPDCSNETYSYNIYNFQKNATISYSGNYDLGLTGCVDSAIGTSYSNGVPVGNFEVSDCQGNITTRGVFLYLKKGYNSTETITVNQTVNIDIDLPSDIIQTLYYRKGNATPKKIENVNKDYMGVYFKLEDTPDLVGYTGLLYIQMKAAFSSDEDLPSQEEVPNSCCRYFNGTAYNLYSCGSSNILTYTIIKSSPALDVSPIASPVKCKAEATGSVTLKFKEILNEGQRFLFNLRKESATDFVESKEASKSETDDKEYTWRGIAAGEKYYIVYQALSSSDSNPANGIIDITGSSVVKSTTFDIAEPALPLTSAITPIQPACSGEQGGVTITASGGTSPYSYIFYNNKGTSISDTLSAPTDGMMIDLPTGEHYIKVVDKNGCFDKRTD